MAKNFDTNNLVNAILIGVGGSILIGDRVADDKWGGAGAFGALIAGVGLGRLLCNK